MTFYFNLYAKTLFALSIRFNQKEKWRKQEKKNEENKNLWNKKKFIKKFEKLKHINCVSKQKNKILSRVESCELYQNWRQILLNVDLSWNTKESDKLQNENWLLSICACLYYWMVNHTLWHEKKLLYNKSVFRIETGSSLVLNRMFSLLLFYFLGH